MAILFYFETSHEIQSRSYQGCLDRNYMIDEFSYQDACILLIVYGCILLHLSKKPISPPPRHTHTCPANSLFLQIYPRSIISFQALTILTEVDSHLCVSLHFLPFNDNKKKKNEPLKSFINQKMNQIFPLKVWQNVIKSIKNQRCLTLERVETLR